MKETLLKVSFQERECKVFSNLQLSAYIILEKPFLTFLLLLTVLVTIISERFRAPTYSDSNSLHVERIY